VGQASTMRPPLLVSGQRRGELLLGHPRLGDAVDVVQAAAVAGRGRLEVGERPEVGPVLVDRGALQPRSLHPVRHERQERRDPIGGQLVDRLQAFGGEPLLEPPGLGQQIAAAVVALRLRPVQGVGIDHRLDGVVDRRHPPTPDDGKRCDGVGDALVAVGPAPALRREVRCRSRSERSGGAPRAGSGEAWHDARPP
jgi:hypothetical protein